MSLFCECGEGAGGEMGRLGRERRGGLEGKPGGRCLVWCRFVGEK